MPFLRYCDQNSQIFEKSHELYTNFDLMSNARKERDCSTLLAKKMEARTRRKVG